MDTDNIFLNIPPELKTEHFQDLFKNNSIRIERIISKGHSSPASGWYDQSENEWVIVLKGSGAIAFADGHEVNLTTGDFIFIPKHQKHRVSWTDPENITVWLAVFYK